MQAGINQSTHELLDHYVNCTPAGEFAILVSGKWGAGKSYFMNKYLELLKSNYQIDSIYISLNGVSSIREVQLQILSQVHPKIVNTYTRGVASLLSSTVNVALTIGSSEKAGDKSVDLVKGMKWLMNKISFSGKRKGAIIVFDDLERCAVSLNEVLGYISNLMQSGQSKIICICAENELQGNDKEYFTKGKEKVFGFTTRVVPDQKGALASFSEKISNQIIRAFVESRSNTLYEIFERSEDENLRNLRFTLQEFERLIVTLELLERLDAEYIEPIFTWLMIISLEYRAGRLQEGNIEYFTSPNYWYSQTWESSDNDDPKPSPFEKYNILKAGNLIFKAGDWEDFCFHGRIRKSSMLQSIYLIESTEEMAWVKLWDYDDLDETTFQKSLQEMIESLETGSWSHPLEIVHAVMLMYHFHENKVLNSGHTQSSIKELGINSVRKLFANTSPDTREITGNLSTGAHAGKGFYSKDSPFYQDFSKAFADEIKKQNIESSKRHIATLPAKLRDSNEEAFSQYLIEFNKLEADKIQYPVFEVFTTSDFAHSIVEIASKRSTRKIVAWCSDIMDTTHRDFHAANLTALEKLTQELETELKSGTISKLSKIKVRDTIKWISHIINKHTAN